MPKTCIDLSGTWQFKEYPVSARRMRDLDGGDWMDTEVPCSIFTSLIGAGVIKERDIESNPEDFHWVSKKPWVFHKVFNLDDKCIDCDRIELNFDGLDTIGSIWLNEKLIGKTDNMFIGHRFDVTEHIRPEGNVLLVKFDPATDYAEKLMERYGALCDNHINYPCRSYIRKAQYQFGWDWGPALPGCGIYRKVTLEGIKTARIGDVHVRTIDCNEHYADVKIAIELDKPAETALSCSLAISGGGLDIKQDIEIGPGDKTHSTIIRIDRPIMWWPKGYGVQHLYKLGVVLRDGSGTIDSSTLKFGIRRVSINRSKLKGRHKFQIEVNDTPIYAKGACFVPMSTFAGIERPKQYQMLLQMAADAGMNIIRIWGGGYYPDASFYEACDRLGIMVWQDFMFACAYYPDRKFFMEAVEKEAYSVVKKLRNHASLAIWCGNNEIDWLDSINCFGKGRKFYGKKIFHKLLPGVIEQLDPDRDYIPTTPFGEDKEPNSPTSGTVHNWNVWSNMYPVRDYVTPKEITPSFVAEFGFQSLPALETVKGFCKRDQLKVGSLGLEKHNYQIDGNDRVAFYMADNFRPVKKLADYIYLSQVTQARAIKTYVEHLRRNNSVNSGVIFWQLNDANAAISWSSIDHRQRPKALYYYAKRFFSPILISLDHKIDSPRPDVGPTFSSIDAVVINDSPKPVTASLCCEVMEMDGKVIDSFERPITIQPFSKAAKLKLPKQIAKPDETSKCVLVVKLKDGNKVLARQTMLYMPDKYIAWPKAKVETEIKPSKGKFKMTLKSDVFVKDYRIGTDNLVSDNFIDLIPGQKHHVMLNSQQDGQNSPRCVNDLI